MENSDDPLGSVRKRDQSLSDGIPSPCPASGARYIWIGVLIVLVMIEGLLMGADAGLWGSANWRPMGYHYGGFWTRLLRDWEPLYTAQPVVMFVSYPFLHTDWQHVLGNGLALGWLGMQLGERISPRRFALLLGLSSLGGAVGFALLSQSSRPMVGASGIVMGLIAAWIALEAREMAEDGKPLWRILGAICAYVLRSGCIDLSCAA